MIFLATVFSHTLTNEIVPWSLETIGKKYKLAYYLFR